MTAISKKTFRALGKWRAIATAPVAAPVAAVVAHEDGGQSAHREGYRVAGSGHVGIERNAGPGARKQTALFEVEELPAVVYNEAGSPRASSSAGRRSASIARSPMYSRAVRVTALLPMAEAGVYVLKNQACSPEEPGMLIVGVGRQSLAWR